MAEEVLVMHEVLISELSRIRTMGFTHTELEDLIILYMRYVAEEVDQSTYDFDAYYVNFSREHISFGRASTGATAFIYDDECKTVLDYLNEHQGYNIED